MGKHSTDISLDLFAFLIDLGNALNYYTESEYPMSENSFGSQAIDIAWFNEKGNKFPLFIFEIESSSNNSIANNPTKIFGKETKVFEKPLFFFHVVIDGAENSEKYTDLMGLFGKYNYDIFRINGGEIERLLLKVISQHRRIREKVNLHFVIRLISVTDAIKPEIKFESFLNNVEKLIHENQLYLLGQTYADIASRNRLFQDQYFKFIYRSYLTKSLSHLAYNSYCAGITSEFINLGILYSKFGKNLPDLDFKALLIEAQKTSTFNKIEYLPGLNYDYDIFIRDYVPFYIALTFFLFDGNSEAQKYMIDIAVGIIRKLRLADDFVFEHHMSWSLLMASSDEQFFGYFEELKNSTNSQNGIIDTILFCPTFINDHRQLPDSKLVSAPDRADYINRFKSEFSHLTVDTNICEIAITSLSEDWKDGLDYHFNLGIDLSNLVIKSL